MPEKILFDLDNAPQVPAAIPIAEELENRGHTVLFSVRNRSGAWDLMKLHNRVFIKFNDSHHTTVLGKAMSTLSRAIYLSQIIKKNRITKAVGLGSRSLPISSWMSNIPSVSIIDYEWVNTTIYNKFNTTILLPEVITMKRCQNANINTKKVKHFPGIRQHIYIKSKPETNSIKNQLALNPHKSNILLRPPATTAHYHNQETQNFFTDTINQLKSYKNTTLYCFLRHNETKLSPEIHKLTRMYKGIELISSFHAIVGAGGSMTREAAILGIPSYTCFKGRMGMVDQYLIDSKRLSVPETNFIPTTKPQPVFSSAEDPISVIVNSILQS